MHPMPSPGGRCPEGADEGMGALADRFAVLSKPTLLPGPHPSAALRFAATFPQGKAWGMRTHQGFPYEGKLSPEATDEVDSAA